MKTRALRAILVSCIVFFGAPGRTTACGFHGPLGPGLTPQHPRSIAVALAVREAVDRGLIGEDAVAPLMPGSAGFWRAVGRLRALQALLTPVIERSGVPVSILLIDSNLWARLEPSQDGVRFDVHTTPAQPGDLVVVTSEAILAAVAEDRLAAGAALASGLIVVDGPDSGAGGAIASALATPIASRPAPPAVRLFGPARRQHVTTDVQP